MFDYLFPKRSLSGREGEWVTAAEHASLTGASRIFERAELRSRGVQSLDRLFALSSYHASPLLKEAIHMLKYRRIAALSKTLTTLLIRGVEEQFPLIPESCLVPVPLHWSRRFHRGFNQAELLSAALSQSSGVPERHLLRRIRPTGHQARRGREERLRALRNAFCLSSPHNVPEHVYVLDDLFTTGATMEECAKVLKLSGAKNVEGIVLAYG